MRSSIAVLLLVALASSAAGSAQPSAEDSRALRERLEQRYDIVPLSVGIALRPKTRGGDVRLIEVVDGAISVNGVVVTGRELRERVGADADAVLRLSYLPADEQRALSSPPPPPPDLGVEADRKAEPPVEAAQGTPPAPEAEAADRPRRARRATGDRVRIFGDVSVDRDEEVTGQVIAVFGSARIDGAVGDQVVAVLGSVNLGPSAVVAGDIVSVGGRVRRSPTAQVRGNITEVSVADSDFRVHVGPWFDGRGPLPWAGAFGAFPRLIGSGFRFLLLLLLTGIVLIVARRSVEASAERIGDNPLKTVVVGLVAQVLIVPVLVLTAIVLAISIIGIPLLLLLPFVALAFVIMALIGFTGTAAAVGQSMQRRFALGSGATFFAVALGLLVILSPLLLGRMLAVAGWPITPFAMLLVGAGFAVELLAWASGFGAMLANTFGSWQASRSARRARVSAPPAVP